MAAEFVAENGDAIDRAAAVKVCLQLLRSCTVVDLKSALLISDAKMSKQKGKKM